MVSSQRSSTAPSAIQPTTSAVAKRGGAANTFNGGPRRPRRVYEASFKLEVVREALKLPASNRIKPTCRAYPGVEPVQGTPRP